MNYYEHHIGDFLKKTAHLSLLKEGIYRRLLDRYYITEEPLPADLKKCCEFARAITKAERDAVADVVSEFFTLEADGYHQGRADEEIERYQEGEPDRQAKRESDAERQRRSRERRKHLFDELRKHNIVPDFKAKNSELEAMLSRVTNGDASRGPVTPVTRDNTATHYPLPNTQYPKKEIPPPAAQGSPQPDKPSKPKREKAPEVTLAEWLEVIRGKGEKAIPTDDTVFAYADGIGLPREFLHVAWFAFRAKYTAEPTSGQKQKAYANWRAVFRNAVRDNWLKLWYLDGQQYALTTAGQQAQRAHQERSQ